LRRTRTARSARGGGVQAQVQLQRDRAPGGSAGHG